MTAQSRCLFCFGALWRCLVVALLLGGGALAQAQGKASVVDRGDAKPCEPSVAWQSVLPGIAVSHGHWPSQQVGGSAHAASSVVLWQAGQATVLDPGPTHQSGLALARAVRCHAKSRVVRLLNSHAHAEQVLANAAWAVPVLATGATQAAMKQRCPTCLAALRRDLGAAALQGTRIVWPTQVVQPGQHLMAGGRRWQVLEMPVAHTESDLVLWSDPDRVVLAGGLLDPARWVLAQGSVQGWLQALSRLQALQPEWLVGQGVVWGPGEVQPGLQAQTQALCRLVQLAWQGLERGDSETEALQQLTARREPLLATPLTSPLAAVDSPERLRQQGFNFLRTWREMEGLWINGDPMPAACSAPDVVR